MKRKRGRPRGRGTRIARIPGIGDVKITDRRVTGTAFALAIARHLHDLTFEEAAKLVTVSADRSGAPLPPERAAAMGKALAEAARAEHYERFWPTAFHRKRGRPKRGG